MAVLHARRAFEFASGRGLHLLAAEADDERLLRHDGLDRRLQLRRRRATSLLIIGSRRLATPTHDLGDGLGVDLGIS